VKKSKINSSNSNNAGSLSYDTLLKKQRALIDFTDWTGVNQFNSCFFSLEQNSDHCHRLPKSTLASQVLQQHFVSSVSGNLEL
jgi:hypothetical protein